MVIERFGPYCHWCGIPLVRVCTINPKLITKQEKGMVYYARRGRGRLTEHCDYFMTVDHVIPLSEGGKSGISNLVPSCEPCNASRGQVKKGDNRVESAQV